MSLVCEKFMGMEFMGRFYVVGEGWVFEIQQKTQKNESLMNGIFFSFSFFSFFSYFLFLLLFFFLHFYFHGLYFHALFSFSFPFLFFGVRKVH